MSNTMVTMFGSQNHLLQGLEGQKQAQLLVHWLNGDPRDPYRKRILKMLHRIFEVLKIRLRSTGGPTEDDLPDGVRFVSSKEFSRRIEEVQRDFDKYLPKLRFAGIDSGRIKGRARLSFIPIWSKTPFQAVLAVEAIKLLGEEGRLERVRQCRKCKRWFYARVRPQKFCSTACQQSHYRSSEEWKEQRREWMRRYRLLKESGYTK